MARRMGRGGDRGDHRGDLDCKVYVGNLPNHAAKDELESYFGKYGPLKSVWVARNPPGFAFVEFKDPRDAEDAVRHLDGTRVCGVRIRAEMSTGRSRNRGGGGGGRGGGGGGPPRRNHYNRSRSRSPQARRRFSRSRSRSRSRSQSPPRGRRVRSRSDSS